MFTAVQAIVGKTYFFTLYNKLFYELNTFATREFNILDKYSTEIQQVKKKSFFQLANIASQHCLRSFNLNCTFLSQPPGTQYSMKIVLFFLSPTSLNSKNASYKYLMLHFIYSALCNCLFPCFTMNAFSKKLHLIVVGKTRTV